MLNPNNHISDTDLQLHLDGQPLNPAQQTHLVICSQCSAQLELYRQMYLGLKQLPAPVLPFNLAEAVIQQLPQPATPTATPNNSHITPTENLWVFATLLVLLLSVGIAAYGGFLGTVPGLRLANTLPWLQILAAALITLFLFQWIEYRFWSKRLIKL